jgi:hypothetical protein
MKVKMDSEKYFNKRLSNSSYWLEKSIELRISAGDIWFVSQNNNLQQNIDSILGFPEGDRFSVPFNKVFVFLCGLSLELIFKAIFISIGEEVKESHDLNELSEKLNLGFSLEDKELLGIYTQTIYWFGKYPIPTKKKIPQIDRLFANINSNLFNGNRYGFTSDGKKIEIRNEKMDWETYNRIWLY